MSILKWILFGILCLIIWYYLQPDYLTTMHAKIFPIMMHQITLPSDIAHDTHYHQIIETSPRQLSLDELGYLIKYKKFMELPNVYSMCDTNETSQMRYLLENVIQANIPGCIVETGVWRGGMTMWMQAILKYHYEHRDIWLFDAFGKFPKSSHNKDNYIHDITEMLFDDPPSVNDVINNFKTHHLYDKNLHFIVGDFMDTVPQTPLDNIAILRCDGDYYDATKVVLENYYWKISNGGYIIIDDYNNPHLACRDAVDEFRKKYQISAPIVDTYGGSVYWQKI